MKKSIYKILSVIMIIAISLTLTVFAEEEAVISVNDVTGERGTVVEVNVEIKNNPGVASLGCYISYDNTALKLVEIVDGGICGETLHSPDLTVCPYPLYWFNPTVTENFTTDGILVTLKFEILAEAKTANYAIGVSYSADNYDILNVELENVYFKVSSGTITVDGKNVEADNDSAVDSPDKSTTQLSPKERAEDAICLKIDNPYAFAFGNFSLIDSTNNKVVPYIKNDRTLVPLRFVSETLGAKVEWEDGWDYCYVNKGDKKIKITFGSADIEVNGDVVTYDAPVEVVQGRTMVPIRFISEELGYHVYWNQPNRVVIITPKDNPWVEKRSAESTLLLDVLVSFLMKKLM